MKELNIELLQQIDDIIFLGKATKENVFLVKSLLRCFELTSGLKVNFLKSSLGGVCIRSTKVELQVGGVPCFQNFFAIQFLQYVYSVVQVCYDPKWTFPVGAKLSCSGIFFGFTLNLPYEVTRLKVSWLNLCIVSPRYSEFGSYFPNPCHVFFNGDHGVCAICKSVWSFLGCCLG